MNEGQKGTECVIPTRGRFSEETQRFLDHNSGLERRSMTADTLQHLDRQLRLVFLGASFFEGRSDNEMSAAAAGPSGRIDSCVCSQCLP
jgi:hypothetical protein